MTAPGLPSLLWRHWIAAWDVDVMAAFAAFAYLAAAARVRRWPAGRTVSFLLGLGTVLVALQSGVGAFDDRMLSDHMVQHLLLLELAPLLMLAGRPAMLGLRAAPRARRAAIARRFVALAALTRPLVCVAIVYTVLLATHLSAVYDATLRSGWLHELEHGLYLVAGAFLWWPMLDADPVRTRRLNGLARLGYAIAVMIPMTLLGAFVYRHATLLYWPYAGAARALGISALTDQALGGSIMWVVGGFVTTLVAIWQAMVALLDEERRQQARDRAGMLAGPGAGR